jgi:hypothetical protein
MIESVHDRVVFISDFSTTTKQVDVCVSSTSKQVDGSSLIDCLL